MTVEWMAREHARFPPGTVIADRYEVVEFLGHGGMGYVLKARERGGDTPGRIIALKFLYSRFATEIFTRKDTVRAKRFRREGELLQKLVHPNIVRIHERGRVDENTRFISMEFVEGETLERKLKKAVPNGLPFDEVMHYLHQIADALSHAHRNEIIHRDVKPANVIVTPEGVAKLADFGVARPKVTTEDLTVGTTSIGSPEYMSGEQISGMAVSARSDVYSLGIMAYQLATGELPFVYQPGRHEDLVIAHLSMPLPNFASPTIPSWYEAIVRKATRKKPFWRGSARALSGTCVRRCMVCSGK